MTAIELNPKPPARLSPARGAAFRASRLPFAAAALLALALYSGWMKAAEADGRRLHGLNFSPNLGTVPQSPEGEEDDGALESWMRLVAPYTRWIRTFESGGRLANAGAVAHRLGLKVAVTAWLGPERDEEARAANERSVARLIELGRQRQVDLAIVGSEVLFRGDLTPAQLLDYVARVKESLPDIPVTTADTYRHLLDHPEILDVADVVFMNHYAYWEGIEVRQAVPALDAAYRDLSSAFPGKPVIVSESGWPTCGETRSEAVASEDNAQDFLFDFLDWAEANQVPYFYFEAFDEPWKAEAEGPQGACWGLWDRSGTLKPGMAVVLEGSWTPVADSVQAETGVVMD
jgi:exo-beta-1,3-glucanase (GH17 family)